MIDRDTVVRLAKEAGLIPIDATSIEFIQGDAIRFATLIANETLERAAKVCDDSAARVAPEGKRTNQIDRHVADVLTDKADAIRALKDKP